MLAPAALAFKMERIPHRRTAPVRYPLHRLVRGEAAPRWDKRVMASRIRYTLNLWLLHRMVDEEGVHGLGRARPLRIGKRACGTAT